MNGMTGRSHKPRWVMIEMKKQLGQDMPKLLFMLADVIEAGLGLQQRAGLLAGDQFTTCQLC